MCWVGQLEGGATATPGQELHGRRTLGKDLGDQGRPGATDVYKLQDLSANFICENSWVFPHPLSSGYAMLISEE